ncbi:MAG TPA: hypothetical protein VMU55_03425 [Solirubrobacteraceae bacterium]|nr:hypothetical protein [Solirubrobacteraceae bacterium]
MSEDRREPERTDVLQRLAAIDDLLAEHNEKLALTMDRAASADEGWRSISRQLERLGLETPAVEERSHANLAGDHHADATLVDATGLLAWVAWLVPAYDLADQWPLCWFRHEGLVAQLLALRRWHTALFTVQLDDPAAPSKWHDTLYRLNERAARRITQTCLATHRNPPAIRVGDEAQLAIPTCAVPRNPTETPRR